MSKDAVLLVDDEPQVLVALDDILSDDFLVLPAHSAEEALGVARGRLDIAVVLTDQRMPKVTGDELVQRLAEFCAATRILVTGFADLSAVIRAVNDGHIFAYVTKPWNRDDLLLKVQKAAQHFHMAKELAHERQLLHDLMDSVPDGIYFKDTDLRFSRVNRAHVALMNGAGEAGLVGRHLRDLLPGDPEALRIEAEERAVLEGAPAVDLVRTRGHDGSRCWLSESKAALRNVDGETIGLVGIARDISERKIQEERIARLTRIHALTSGINAMIVRTRERTAVLAESCRIAAQVGELGLAFAIGRDPSNGLVSVLARSPADSHYVAAVQELARSESEAGAALRRSLESACPIIVADPAEAGFPRTERDAALALFPLRGGEEGPAALCLLSRGAEPFDQEEIELLTDVTDNVSFGLEHISKSQRLDFLAYHDELTGLPNRALFLDRLHQRIADARGADDKAAVLVVDIGRFRQVNETLGRGAGDQLLMQIAQRLARSLRDRDTIARFDSNTFAVLCSTVSTEAEVAHLVGNAVLPALKDSFTVQGTELRVAAKVGIALFPSDGDTGDSVILHAEAALKNAKRSLASYLFYAPNMHERVSERLTLETRLRRAVEAKEFELHYQPKVDLRSGAVVGLEALLRWHHPEAGQIAPVHFIPLLEETGLIHEVGHWALDQAGTQFGEWVAAGLNPPRIAVNVSAIQLAAPDLEQTLRDCPTSSESIDIEITESVFVKDLAGSVSKLEAARRLGLRVAIDDFGTGYSSLGYLSRLPIDALKIDRSFIIGMATDPQETTIVTTIISLAHAMDLKVIAEGVETNEQARLLRLLKCDQIQGYLVSRPGPAPEIAKILDKRYTFSDVAQA
jgi:diguanylate cyclase (GGDEF)-like protein/PAS domain S-box-containing protein